MLNRRRFSIDSFSDEDGSDEQYGFMDGTSMATPHVAGLAALIWGTDKSLSYSELKNAILNTGDSLASLNEKTTTGKRINARRSLSQFFGIDPISVFRFFNKIYGNHFYTQSEIEKNSITANLSDIWNYEGVSYNAYNTQESNTSPIYRFFNTNMGYHFYTQSEVEKNDIIANLPVWNYEGIAYYAYSLNEKETLLIYRFFNKIQGNRFYTTSSTERDGIIANLSDTWNYEGTAWYVPE